MPLAVDGFKVCSRYECSYQGKPQPLENFNNCHSSMDGKASYCKECSKVVSKQFRDSPSKKKPTRILVKLEWREAVKKANKVVRQAVKTGKLPHISTLQCIKCKTQAKEYHHYLGYEPEHWLDVVPTCIRCHRYLHRYLYRETVCQLRLIE